MDKEVKIGRQGPAALITLYRETRVRVKMYPSLPNCRILQNPLKSSIQKIKRDRCIGVPNVNILHSLSSFQILNF
jgi:hypothetical protein